DIRDDVQISLVIQACPPSRRHGVANGIEPLREGFSLPSELEGAIGQVGRLRFSAMEVGPVAARADSLVRRLSLLRLLLGKDAGGSGFCLLCMEQARSAEHQQTAHGSSDQHLNGPYGVRRQLGSAFPNQLVRVSVHPAMQRTRGQYRETNGHAGPELVHRMTV